MLSGMRETLHAAFLGLVASLCLLAYVFPYFYLPGIWWRAIPSTVLILAIGAWVHGEGALAFFGLRMSRRALLLSVSLFMLGVLVFRFLILPAITAQALTVSLNGRPLGYVHQFFQVLNDEMVLRAACLTLLLRIVPYPKTVVIATAVLFSVGHHLVYRMNGVVIDWPALVSLFSFGAITNLLFVRFGHIGYGVALHYAWNFYRFNSVYRLDGLPLSEGMTFNYVEGNLWIVSASLIAVTYSVLRRVRNLPRSRRALDQPLHQQARKDDSTDDRLSRRQTRVPKIAAFGGRCPREKSRQEPRRARRAGEAPQLEPFRRGLRAKTRKHDRPKTAITITVVQPQVMTRL